MCLPQILVRSLTTNIAPENRPSQNEIHLPTINFQVRAVSFMEGNWMIQVIQIFPVIGWETLFFLLNFMILKYTSSLITRFTAPHISLDLVFAGIQLLSTKMDSGKIMERLSGSFYSGSLFWWSTETWNSQTKNSATYIDKDPVILGFPQFPLINMFSEVGWGVY